MNKFALTTIPPVFGLVLFAASPTSANPIPPAVQDSDYYFNGAPDEDVVKLGKRLFFDKILSGNGNISCATCHHPLTETGDGLSLPVGEGGAGLGTARNTGTGSDAIHERVPRNSPPLFNLGAKSMTHMFHDGRIFVDQGEPSGFVNPAGNDLPTGLDNVLAAQAMFPVTSATEMAGQPGENDIADAVDAGDLAGPNGVWALLANRLKSVPKYVDLFYEAYGVSANDITFVLAANAIAAYETETFRSDDSPFDRYLRGDTDAMSPLAINGMNLFYGSAGCSDCHSGAFQTDMSFHGIAMPQVGPGKGDGASGHEDFGRKNVSGLNRDKFAFRTPPLRNVEVTAPYGHAGAYPTLRQVIKHHEQPIASLEGYECDKKPRLPSRTDLDVVDCFVMNDPTLVQKIANKNDLDPQELSKSDIDALIAFLESLTDSSALDLRRKVPNKPPPSGLPLAD
ncbi:MAG: cytochrome-c peroxidase [Myxococcales bacterium FL481]|nr:MAG: cytochrome-c peroxidase [Myxococcales bacterium FL481]